MKKISFKSLLLIISSIFLITVSCEEIAPETCQEDEICDGKSVQACCTATIDDGYDCVYKYDGKEYPDSDIDVLADLLGCADTKSTSFEKDNEAIIAALQELMDRVRCSDQ